MDNTWKTHAHTHTRTHTRAHTTHTQHMHTHTPSHMHTHYCSFKQHIFSLMFYCYSKTSISPDNILLRGAQLKNTDYIYGLVIYTGHDSKILQNTRWVPLKRSHMDHVTNKQVWQLYLIIEECNLNRSKETSLIVAA